MDEGVEKAAGLERACDFRSDTGNIPNMLKDGNGHDEVERTGRKRILGVSRVGPHEVDSLGLLPVCPR